MATQRSSSFFGLTGYQWLVIAAAWLGWGFDVFDALLFNFVAPNAVPALLGLTPGTPEAREATVLWTGIISSVLLVGWAVGGVLFGWFADRFGRRRAFMITVLLYAGGTGLCAFVTDIWQLLAFRSLAALGIGGEWAIGAVLVAEVVPENRRIFAGTLLYTASPLALLLAGAVNYQIAGVWFAHDPMNSWRYVFLAGLAPIAVALLVRSFVDESHVWQASRDRGPRPALRELFTPQLRRATLAGFAVSVVALVTWWACNAFIPLLGSWLALEHAPGEVERWKSAASNAFNFGGLLGAFAAWPLASLLGRRPMYFAYFAFSAITVLATFGLDVSPEWRLRLLFVMGIGVYGVFATHVIYLPELFPARLRGTGSGFSYNIGRVIAAFGPPIVGIVTAAAGGSSAALMQSIVWVAIVPAVAAVLVPWIVIETRGKGLPS